MDDMSLLNIIRMIELNLALEDARMELGGWHEKGENSGHGHIHPRPDGVMTRCGGPGICNECSIESLVVERDKALLSLDLEYARKLWPVSPADDEVLLTVLHNARYECTSLPASARHESESWLRLRRYGRLAGPLLPIGELPK